MKTVNGARSTFAQVDAALDAAAERGSWRAHELQAQLEAVAARHGWTLAEYEVALVDGTADASWAAEGGAR